MSKPEGYHTHRPDDPARADAIEFYKKTFDATELMRETDPGIVG